MTSCLARHAAIWMRVLALIIAGALSGCSSDKQQALLVFTPATPATFAGHMKKHYGITYQNQQTGEPSAAVRLDYAGDCNWIHYRYEMWRNGTQMGGTGQDAAQGHNVQFPADVWFLAFRPDTHMWSEASTRIRIRRVSANIAGDRGHGSSGDCVFAIELPPELAAKGIKRIDLAGIPLSSDRGPHALWAFVPETAVLSPHAEKDLLSVARQQEWCVILTVTLTKRGDK